MKLAICDTTALNIFNKLFYKFPSAIEQIVCSDKNCSSNREISITYLTYNTNNLNDLENLISRRIIEENNTLLEIKR